MEPTDVTVEILRSIRDEVRDGLAAANQRIDQMREELSRRIVESEMRTATAITGLAGSIQDLTMLLKGQHDLRPRVERCEKEIESIKKRMGRRSPRGTQ